MAPKSKAKKVKKGDDNFWASVDASVGSSTPVQGDASDSNDHLKVKDNEEFSRYSALAMEDTGDNAEVPEEDFGGLMSAIRATTKSKKEKKKSKKTNAETANAMVAFADDPSGERSVGEVMHTQNSTSCPTSAVEVTADDLVGDEWLKGKKAKKGKAMEDGNEKVLPAESPALTPLVVEQDLPEEGGSKILSKKEKEKLKKDREKAKKKAQATARKVGDGRSDLPSSVASGAVDAPPAAPAPQIEVDGDEGEEGGGIKADSKKKKKKKTKKDEEPSPAPPATKKKGGISALKALMEEKRRIEEEAKRREEEERKRIEEEERQAEEELKRKEEEKQRRKEREKAKRELAKKEGRLLTKRQKDERMMAERRKQALLASGVQIEGLQQVSSNGAPKRVVYGNRKKKGPDVRDASPAPTSRPLSPEPVFQHVPQPLDNDGVKSDWDVSSNDGDGESKVPGVKESWDASSEEDHPQPAPAPTTSTQSAPQANLETPTSTSAHRKPTTPISKLPGNVVKQSSSRSEEELDGDSTTDSEEESDDGSSSPEEMTHTQRMAAQRKAEAALRRAQAHEAALAARNKDNLRSPICCILGHVDTGKTKLLDKIRQTNVQEGEAGGITQQIGATYFPVDAIRTKTEVMNKDGTQEYKIPGLLIIDTPGHESFTNLRSRGSSLCNIAILVVDIMHGLEPQTLESLRLLRERKTPFIVALNKIDRMYGWNATPDGAFQESLSKQKSFVQSEFKDRVGKTIVAFAEQGLNAALYYSNDSPGRTVSLIPTSAITGEGIPDMIMLLVNLTQQRMSDRLMYLSELECTVLEVKVIEGLGTTIDVVLSNGILREGDRIVVCGLNGPIVTQVRALLTPQPLRELRIKSAYIHHKEVKAALGVKITAPDLEKAIAGSRLLVVGPDDDEDDLRDEVMSDLTSLLNSIDKSGRGVCVQASTLGSLEALLDFLKVSKIPVSGINIGPVYKRDIMRSATMLEKAKELACILCFDVPVDKDAERLADEMGIRLFKADIIYHLFDAFTAYNAEILEAKRRDAAPQAVWPCRLKIIAAFCKRDPIILGVDILDGTLRVGTPLAVVKVDPATQKKEIIDLGKITSLEINHKTYEIVKKSQAGGGVAVKIEHAVYQSAKLFGRHFDEKDEVLSHISRQSIDVLKNTFKAEVTTEEWQLIRFLKSRFNIP